MVFIPILSYEPPLLTKPFCMSTTIKAGTILRPDGRVSWNIEVCRALRVYKNMFSCCKYCLDRYRSNISNFGNVIKYLNLIPELVFQVWESGDECLIGKWLIACIEGFINKIWWFIRTISSRIKLWEWTNILHLEHRQCSDSPPSFHYHIYWW
jgi:hypothetical protein